MATKFKVGDVVQLKSGGPLMTVFLVKEAGPAKDSFDHDRDSNEYYCQWFEGGREKTIGLLSYM